MLGYKEFPEEVKEIFKDFVERYSLDVIEENDSDIIFRSPKCFLLISTEYYYTEVYFKEKENDRWMSIGPYLSALFPNEKITLTHNSERPMKESVRSSIKDMLRLLENYGDPFLSGDFSWRDEYNKHQ